MDQRSDRLGALVCRLGLVGDCRLRREGAGKSAWGVPTVHGNLGEQCWWLKAGRVSTVDWSCQARRRSNQQVRIGVQNAAAVHAWVAWACLEHAGSWAGRSWRWSSAS